MSLETSTEVSPVSPPLKVPVYRPVGFWMRFLSHVIDVMVLSFVCFPVTFLIGFAKGFVRGVLGDLPLPLEILFFLLQFGFGLVFTFLYCGYFYRRSGATPGKAVLGLTVFKLPHGTRPSYTDALVRDGLGRLVSGLMLGIGYLMVAFRKDKRAFHDLLGNTWVLKKVDSSAD